MALLKSGKPDPVAGLRVDIDKLLVDEPCPVKLLVTKLKLDVRKPGLLVRFPLHPSLKDCPGSRDVVQHLLHVSVLVPELGRTR